MRRRPIHTCTATRPTTTDPQRIGTREPNATVTGTLLVPNASVSVTVETTAPAVSASTTYYYYVCVDLVEDESQGHNNCSGTPASVTVQSDSAPADETADEIISATPEDETPEPTGTPNFTIPAFAVSPTNPGIKDTGHRPTNGQKRRIRDRKL